MYTSRFTNTITTEVEVEVAHKYKVGDVIRRCGDDGSALDRRITAVNFEDGEAFYSTEYASPGGMRGAMDSKIASYDDPMEWKLVPPTPLVTYNITIEQYGGVGTYCEGIKHALDKYLQSNILSDDEKYHVVIRNDKSPRFDKDYNLNYKRRSS